jgi:hypothetical protein
MNRVWILLQRQDATFVKGRKQWEKEGRTVRRGARAIYIFAPALKPDERADTLGFTSVKVYDVSDTDGGPFTPPCVPVGAKASTVAARLRDLEDWVRGSGLVLHYAAPGVNALIDGATNGLEIWVRPDFGPAERLGVLAHEIAHVRLHFRRKNRGQVVVIDDPKRRPPRDVRELEAELTAFLLLELSGIDSSRGSAAYLNSWEASVKSCWIMADMSSFVPVHICARHVSRTMRSIGYTSV